MMCRRTIRAPARPPRQLAPTRGGAANQTVLPSYFSGVLRSLYMRQFIQRVAACAGLLALGALPIAGQAATAEPSTTYTTALTQTYGSLAPYTGSLKLTVGSDGIVRGYYFPADYSASYIPVTGGRTGDRIWFDIGNDGQYH